MSYELDGIFLIAWKFYFSPPISLDYFQSKRHGLLAADALQADLASLEREYMVGLQQTVPIKWTVSLFRDFPLQFGQLKAKGRCTFMTSATPLDLAYPGSFNHRIRAVQITSILPVTEPPLRGMLTNPGISLVEDVNIGDSHTLVRPLDVLPLSKFNLKVLIIKDKRHFRFLDRMRCLSQESQRSLQQ